MTAAPRSLVALASATTACWVPTTRITRTSVVASQPEPIVERRGPIALDAQVTSGGVLVTATWPRTCYQVVTDVIDVARTRSGELVGTTDGARWGWFLLAGMIVAWPVGIAAGVGSIVGTVAAPPRTELRRAIEVRAVGHRDCSVPAAHVVVYVTMPSGAVTGGVTSDDGTLVILAPGDAAGTGEAAVAIDDDIVDTGALPPQLPAAGDRAGCLTWRATLLAEASRGDPGRARDLRHAAVCPASASDEQLAERAWQLIGPAVAVAIAGDCGPALAVDDELRAHHPTEHQREFAAVPAVARCRAAEAERQRTAAARAQAATRGCERARATVRSRALATSDPRVRGQLLRSMPTCAAPVTPTAPPP